MQNVSIAKFLTESRISFNENIWSIKIGFFHLLINYVHCNLNKLNYDILLLKFSSKKVSKNSKVAYENINYRRKMTFKVQYVN